jgi:hypothetical protein
MQQNPSNEVVERSAIAETPLVFDRQVREGGHERFSKEPTTIARYFAVSMNTNSFEPATR